MNTRHIASLGLIISLIALSSIPVTQVTAGEHTFLETDHSDPLVPPFIPGNDTFYVISNYDDYGNWINEPKSTLVFPKHISEFYWQGNVYEGFQKWNKIDDGKL